MDLADTCSHFFKVILPATLQDKELGIPQKFVRKFGDELCSAATLNVANGRAWQVGLRKDGRNIWFNDGLHDFLEYYSICAGYFLVFKHVKNSNFHVLIFDMTACEINYPCNGEEPEDQDFNMQGKNCKMEKLVEKNDGSMRDELNDSEVYNLQGSLLRRSHLNRSPDATNLKVNRTKLKEATHSGRDERGKEVVDAGESFSMLDDMQITMPRNYRYLAMKVKKRLISAARLFKLTNPSFMILLQSSSMCRRVYLPIEFSRKYVPENAASIKVKVSDGREWPVEISHCRGWVYTQRGWIAFSKEMNLKAGDICVFELIRLKDFVMKVSVFTKGTLK